MVLQAITGRPPRKDAVDDLMRTMRADPLPWVGPSWVFLGTLAWLDFAMRYIEAAAPDAARPLVDDAAAMLARLVARGNVFHTIPYLQRGSPHCAVATTSSS